MSAKQMGNWRAALAYWDKRHHNPENAEAGDALRAAFAAMWFIENVADDAPDRTDIFFEVRELYRQAIACC